MKPSAFTYHAPGSIAEVLELLTVNQDADVRVIAGGQSLVPLMNFRLAQPEILVDLQRVPELAAIAMDTSGLTLGAMVRQSEAETSSDVQAYAPLISEALGFVAHPTVRHSGTVGGSIAHADPSAELPAVTLALRAELILEGPNGNRVVPADEFYDGPFSTVIEPDEILVAVRVPRQWQGQAFVEFARTNGSFALAGVGTCVDLVDGQIQSISIGMSGVGPTAMRANAAETLLTGADPTPENVRAAAEAATDELRPAPDIHASTPSRITITQNCLRRSIQTALHRAQEGR
jgi:carbon-monoxide dehydrogenase medium subunit